MGGFLAIKDKKLKQYNLGYLGISEDIAFPLYRNFYFGLNLGFYIKSKQDSRVGSAFSFGEKAFLGIRWGWGNLELFVRHFSNGGLKTPNVGYNFAGLAMGWLY
ncbi:acyloxyacyl hydrolase [Helicobacter sp. 11S03491-1]|uniref:acyloxyacyl hydrolase n=1 Tax=Helicobacter sp. 11S03491-1 TaxID=1476196 RepID=UPI0015DA1AE7|nr:acyloxyacyl hydrolase [Helicobacter sp. 11S03491-1]